VLAVTVALFVLTTIVRSLHESARVRDMRELLTGLVVPGASIQEVEAALTRHGVPFGLLRIDEEMWAGQTYILRHEQSELCVIRHSPWRQAMIRNGLFGSIRSAGMTWEWVPIWRHIRIPLPLDFNLHYWVGFDRNGRVVDRHLRKQVVFL